MHRLVGTFHHSIFLENFNLCAINKTDTLYPFNLNQGFDHKDENLIFLGLQDKYRHFAVSGVSVQEAWVTFCVSFDNFLQISH